MRFRFLACLLVAAIAACSDTAAPPTVFGTYHLETVDENPLPALLLQQGDYAFRATDGSYVLRENGTFSSSQTWHEEYQGWTHLSTHTFEGTFSIAGDSVTFVWPSDGSTWTGMLRNNELSVRHDDQAWLFRK